MAFSRSMEHTFEEMPLFIIDGMQCASINVRASIDYSADNYWQISEIGLEGWRPATEAEKKALSSRVMFIERIKWITPDHPLHPMILNALNGHWSDKVQDAVEDQIREDREHEADEYADYRREAMREALP